MVNEARDYKRENGKRYGWGKKPTPKQKRNRLEKAMRHRARRMFEKLGKVRKFDGKDIHHVNGNPMDNRKKNLKAICKSKNRSLNKK